MGQGGLCATYIYVHNIGAFSVYTTHIEHQPAIFFFAVLAPSRYWLLAPRVPVIPVLALSRPKYAQSHV